ncbi:hypothetical protein BsWGS_04867 [Bradybaena similaris]
MWSEVNITCDQLTCEKHSCHHHYNKTVVIINDCGYTRMTGLCTHRLSSEEDYSRNNPTTGKCRSILNKLKLNVPQKVAKYIRKWKGGGGWTGYEPVARSLELYSSKLHYCSITHVRVRLTGEVT